MHKLITILAAVLMTVCAVAAPKHYELKSPDGKLTVKVETKDGLCYTLTHDDDLLLDKSYMAMNMMDGTTFGKEKKQGKVSYRSVDQTIDAIAYKKSKVSDKFNEMTLAYKDFSVIFRAYDDGMAYRFVSHLKKPADLQHELVYFNFAQDWNMWAAYVSQHTETLDSQFYNSFENHYSYAPISEWNTERLAFLPLMVDGPNGKKIVITESDLDNYPGMYLYRYVFDEASALTAKFAPYPKVVKQGGHNNLQMEVQSREGYIAQCEGVTTFPWRVVAVSENDVDMVTNNLVYKLATPADPATDWSWVKPGKVAWDWWNDWGLYGVDFEPGINNRTYEYYIDFAARNGIEYVILDEGWSVNKKADLMQVIPEIDVKHLCDYAKERGVGIVLWAGYWALNRDMDRVMKHYAEMGVKGFKIDFMDRDDQQMVDFYERAAVTAAKYKLMCDFHGAYKPCGLSRKYPNVVNYEGVNGLEQMKWSTIELDQVTYDVTVPYIRMMAGPMDYTQGAMRNASRGNYRPVNSEPMSQGTRCRQLGMYVVYESPFNMLCDSPVHYEREQECTDFIAAVPTVWDETVAIDGKVGDYVVVARRKGEVWYIGGLTDWDERKVEIDLGFLGDGEWTVELFSDGVNVDRNAKDYKKSEFVAGRSLTVNMASGGGFAARIKK